MKRNFGIPTFYGQEVGWKTTQLEIRAISYRKRKKFYRKEPRLKRYTQEWRRAKGQ